MLAHVRISMLAATSVGNAEPVEREVHRAKTCKAALNH
jgi:hypothetical protein